MNLLVLLSALCLYDEVLCAIRDSSMLNKLVKVKPVGRPIANSFVPLTEIPAPQIPHLSGRRHLPDECTQRAVGKEIYEGGRVELIGDYYDDGVAKTVATVIMPDHIDYKHFQVTTQVPYLTVGRIEGIGYHHSTIKSEHPSECEKIYQDHMEELYSDDDTDYSEESLEMAKMPIGSVGLVPPSLEERLEDMYEDVS